MATLLQSQIKMGILAIFFQISDQIFMQKAMFMVFHLLYCVFCYLNMSHMCIYYFTFIKNLDLDLDLYKL